MVIDRLQRSLVDGGWLITSPTETSNVQFSAFTAVEFPGAFLYRKTKDAGLRTTAVRYQAPLSDAQAMMPRAPVFDVPLGPADFGVAQLTSVPEGGVQATEPGDADLHERDELEMPWRKARTCANEGRLAEAGQWCERAIAAEKLNPAHYYLLSIIQQEQGESEKAERALRHVLYLEPDFVLAHFALGNLCLAGRRYQKADQHFKNALALLRACPSDAVLPESDGLTAGRLIEVIASVQVNFSLVRKELIA